MLLLCYQQHLEVFVLTGDISHHSHIFFIAVAELVSISISRRGRHLVVTGVVVERHHDVWCEEEKMQDVGIIYLYKTSLLFQMWRQKGCVWGTSVGGMGVVVADSPNTAQPSTQLLTARHRRENCSISQLRVLDMSPNGYVPYLTLKSQPKPVQYV